MNAVGQFDLKAKGKPTLTLTITADSELELLDRFDKVLCHWESYFPPEPTKAPRKAAPVEPEVKPETEPVKMSDKRAKHIAMNEANERLLFWLKQAQVLIDGFKAMDLLDVVKAYGFTKPIAAMDLSELRQAEQAVRDGLKVYSATNEAAAAYLEIIGLIESATSVEDLEAKKATFGKWKILSAVAPLFEAARTYNEQRMALLGATEALAS